MRLIGTPTSPFVRKVRVLALELGLGDALRFEVIDTRDPANGLEAHNPLRKVPTLLRDDGSALYDSSVICDWLCQRFAPPSFLPEGEGRWAVFTTQALADGLLDAGLLARLETLRPEGERSPAFIDKQMATVATSLAALDRDAAWRRPEPDLGQIAVACALGWLAFRFPDHGWQARWPGLAAWFAGFAARPSLQATVPANP